MRDAATGDLVFSKPTPNPDPERYIQDKDNPLVFRPRFPLCIYQEERTKIYPCKKVGKFRYCNLKRVPVVAQYCWTCKERKEQ